MNMSYKMIKSDGSRVSSTNKRNSIKSKRINKRELQRRELKLKVDQIQIRKKLRHVSISFNIVTN